ncbi:hypothetical protein CP49_23490 [Bradyrhizobium valentinum]|uniref:Uncharacterized protein n=1 Tax=Bradyrhizobium valentinum TaxID=1518501 RepID=A0A0R3MAH2_9BRAD|nr:hypothetical protein CP49_23490 [Bradyrhizobium valentinum]
MTFQTADVSIGTNESYERLELGLHRPEAFIDFCIVKSPHHYDHVIILRSLTKELLICRTT